MTEYMISVARVRGRDADGDRETEVTLDTYVSDDSPMAISVLQLIAGLLCVDVSIGLTATTDGHETTWAPPPIKQPDPVVFPGDGDPRPTGGPKRTRRSKAQIEEDKRREAEAADGARDGTPPSAQSSAGAVPAYVPGAVSAPPAAQPVDAAAPAQPIYNPFGG